MGVEYTLRLSGAGAKELASAIWSAATNATKTKGKMRLATLLKSGKELKVFNITQDDLATFAREAKRYGAVYAVVKSAKDDPTSRTDVLVKAEDAAKINRILDRLKYKNFDATDVVTSAKRELEDISVSDYVNDDLSHIASSNPSKRQRRDSADKIIERALGTKHKNECTLPENPTTPLAEMLEPHPLEVSSNPDAQKTQTVADSGFKRQSGDRAKLSQADSKSKETNGKDKRRSVKEQIDCKRLRRKRGNLGKVAKQHAQQAHHQNAKNKKRKSKRQR